jgi:chromodomain-helicase-DNA-binding protein 4
MLEALKESSEPKYLIDQATKYLRGLKGNLVREKKKALERSMTSVAGPSHSSTMQPINPPNGVVRQTNGTPIAASLQERQAHPPQPAPVAWEQLPVADRLRILTSDATKQA